MFLFEKFQEISILIRINEIFILFKEKNKKLRTMNFMCNISPQSNFRNFP